MIRGNGKHVNDKSIRNIRYFIFSFSQNTISNFSLLKGNNYGQLF